MAKNARRTGSASDFIRKHPDLAPAEVVAAGAKQGIKFSRNLVYLVRGPQTSGRRRGGGSAPPGPAPRPAEPRRPDADARALALAILDVGVDRAEKILAQLKRALQ